MKTLLQRRKQTCLILFVAAACLSGQLVAQCAQCPTGAQCGCINCSPCNSGSFSVMCVCYPVAGKTTCSTTSGDCALGKCASCTSQSANQSCTTYGACSGMNCPTGGCTGGGGGFRAASLNAQIFDAQVVPDGDRIWRLKYSIANKAITSLKAIVTEWTVRSTETGEETKFHRVVDSWVQGRRVAGLLGSGVDDLQLRIAGPKGVEMSSVEVLYAEFDDGSIEGSASSCVRKKLLEKRESIAQAAREIQTKLRTGTPIEEVRKLLGTDPDLQYVLIETVGGESIERIEAATHRIASQPR